MDAAAETGVTMAAAAAEMGATTADTAGVTRGESAGEADTGSVRLGAEKEGVNEGAKGAARRAGTAGTTGVPETGAERRT